MSSESVREAFIELQGRLVDTDRKMKQVKVQEDEKEIEKRRATLTAQELGNLPEGTNTYRAIGRSFVLEPVESLKSEQVAIAKDCETALSSLENTKTYLQSQMKEVQNNFRELMQQNPNLARQIMAMSPPGMM